LLISVGINAQFNYQAIVKDSDGNPVTNNQVKFKFSLMYQSSTATPVFIEEHDITTPADGVVNLSVGGGTVVNGTFSNIDWSNSVFMKEELDTGSGYQDMGTRQIASVPVAEYAKNASTLNGINLELKNTYIATSAVETITSQSLTALGFDALKNKTTGNGDTAIGRSALGKTTSGNNNTAIGTFSLGENIEGSKNTAVGLNALRSITNQSNNTAVGYRAGYGSTTFSGNSNTFIGNETSLGLEQVNNATAIGADAIVTASNTIQLGNTDVTLVNTSGIVSATGFKGNGDYITLTESGTTITLLELIENLKSEIKSLRSINLNLLGPIALYSMENNTSNTFPNYNGISNQMSFDSNNMVIGSYAGIFDGSSSFINLGDYDFLGNDPITINSFSISTWCYFTDLESTNNSIITKWDDEGEQKSWYFGQYDQNFQSNSRNLHFAHSDNNGNETLAFSNNFAVTENNWHHCVLVWDRSTVKFYVDGINVGTVENNDFNEAVNNSVADLIIGARDQGTHEHFNGLIDQMRLIPRALNESEVLLLYQERFN